MIAAHLPRMPPIGFLGVGATPTCAGASSRRTALDDNNRVCVVRTARRAIKAQAIALLCQCTLGGFATSSPFRCGPNCPTYIRQKFLSTCTGVAARRDNP
jgi:hypothetical protein